MFNNDNLDIGNSLMLYYARIQTHGSAASANSGILLMIARLMEIVIQLKWAHLAFVTVPLQEI